MIRVVERPVQRGVQRRVVDVVEACGGNDGNRDRSAESTGQNDEELMSADGDVYDEEPSEDAGPDGASLRDDDVNVEVGAAEGPPEPDPQR